MNQDVELVDRSRSDINGGMAQVLIHTVVR
jgi:hypothetical protein